MTSAPAAAGPDPCAAVDFRNRTYDLPDTSGPITIADGQGQRGDLSSDDFLSMQVNGIAAGDIGGDDAQIETAVLINTNTGGTGQFSNVYIFTCTGSTATHIAQAGAGDRGDDGIRAMSISSGTLVIDRYGEAEGACCPTQAIRRAFTLSGEGLSAAGPLTRRKIVPLEACASCAPTPVSFLPGTSGAIFFGTAGPSPATATLDAAAGQTVTLAVEPAFVGLPSTIAELRSGATVLVTATSGESKQTVLPTTGAYTVVFRPAIASEIASIDAELTIS